MKEGSIVLVALLLAAGIASRPEAGPMAAMPRVEPPAAPQPPAPALRPESAQAEHLEVPAAADGAGKLAVCAELSEVVRDVDAALLHPRSPAASAQLAARQRTYLDKRLTLGC